MARPELQQQRNITYSNNHHHQHHNASELSGAIRRSASSGAAGYGIANSASSSGAIVGGSSSDVIVSGTSGKSIIVSGGGGTGNNGSSGGGGGIIRMSSLGGGVGGGSSCGSNLGHSSSSRHPYDDDGGGSSSIVSCSVGGRSTLRIGGGASSTTGGGGGVGGRNSNDALIVPGSQIEIIVDPMKCDRRHRGASFDDIEQGGGVGIRKNGGNNTDDDNAQGDKDDGETSAGGGSHTRRLRHRNRPLLRRFISYVRTAFQGVHFSSSNDSELEELENLPPRYRPDSLSALCRATRFTEAEIKRIYRGFKAECPTGVVKEDTFKIIYASFFPQGANTGLYAHYVFNTLDQDNSGIVSFEEFVQGLSVLSRGSLEEKLRWTFSLYDINGDGYITREEMTDIVTAIFELMGRLPDTCPDEERIKEKVDRLFEKMDVNRDGVVTLDEFLDCCRNDAVISRSIAVFDTTF